MSIKQSVIFLLLLMGASFSVSAQLYRVDEVLPGYCDINVGDIVAPSAFDCFIGKSIKFGNSTETVGKVTLATSGGNDFVIRAWADTYYDWENVAYINYGHSCPSGTELNPDNGKCEEPKPVICESGTELNPDSGKCEELQPETCEDLKYKDAPSPSNRVPDDGKPLTATRSYCDTSTMCEAAHFYYASEDGMHVSNTFTGFECVGTTSDYADSPWYADRPLPEPEPQPDPTHTPIDDTGPIEDPSVLPDSSTNTPYVEPESVDLKPDVPTPEPTPDSNNDVVQSIANMNTDINKLLTDLNKDLNKDNSEIQAELKALNEQALDNTKAIVDLHNATKQAAENEKSLLLGLNTDVTTAVNNVANAVNTGIGKLESDLQSIGDTLDGKGLVVGDHGSMINFHETPLYQASEVEKLTQEIEELKDQYNEKVNDFKKLFSLNLDSLSDGEYREHFLDFEFANGAKLRMGSSVFPALIDNSGIIASVILFVAAIAGLRVIMGAKD